MHTEEVAKNIYRIPVPLPDNPLRELSSYLIKDPVRSLLIDTGFHTDSCRDALLSGLAELNADPGEVDIFLTHMHSDHSGLAAGIVGEGRRILISEIDRKLLSDTADEEGDVWENVANRFRAAGMPALITDNMKTINPAVKYSAPAGRGRYTVVQDGDTLRAGGYTLRCIHTPGHTPGHMCLWDEGSGLMFTGDHVLFDITPNITAWPNVSDSLGDYLDSLQAVLKYPVKTALPGHRKSGDFAARIDALLRHHELRLTETERIINENPGLTAYEIAGKMSWRIRADSWEAFPPAQKIFAVGECMSHLDYLRKRGGIRREMSGSMNRYYSV